MLQFLKDLFSCKHIEDPPYILPDADELWKRVNQRFDRNRTDDLSVLVNGLPISEIQFMISGEEPFDLTGCVIESFDDGSAKISMVGRIKNV